MHWNDYNIPDNPPTEEEFMEHAFDLMDQAVKDELYWILGDAFRNAEIFFNSPVQQHLREKGTLASSGSDWSGKGYWEFVHDSIDNANEMRRKHLQDIVERERAYFSPIE